MITWLALAPLLALPGLAVFVAGLLPALEVLGRPVGGALVRHWCVEHWVIPLLPAADATRLLAWYAHSGKLGEVLLHALVAVNLNAALLPLLAPLAAGLLRLNHWATKTDLDLKRKAIKG